ncbi:hypothetical protein BU15DRAFT_76840 [Melanogaster broomeanus]|nr:hypothetical protein BU15DRAFT_76840 [Melanogaster broomeanus]
MKSHGTAAKRTHGSQPINCAELRRRSAILGNFQGIAVQVTDSRIAAARLTPFYDRYRVEPAMLHLVLQVRVFVREVVVFGVSQSIVFDAVLFRDPFKSDYVIANSEENYSSPSRHSKLREPLTTIRYSKSFPFSLAWLPVQASFGSVFKLLARDAAAAGRKVIRAVDSAKTPDIGINIVQPSQNSSRNLESSQNPLHQTRSLKYTLPGSFALKASILGEDVEAVFGLVLHDVDLAAVPVEISSSANFLVSNGAILLSVPASGVHVEDVSVGAVTLGALAEKLADIAESSIQVSDFIDGRVYVRVSQPGLAVPAGPFESVSIQSFEHVQEGDLMEIAVSKSIWPQWYSALWKTKKRKSYHSS